MPRKVVIFSGRFQPFHAGHYETYEYLTKKFGKDNVFIATSDKQDPETSPFSFDEKKDIITTMFDIPSKMVRQVKSPYRPIEITETLPEDTIVITPVSEKDRERAEKQLAGKYYKSLDDTPPSKLNRFSLNGYYIITPNPTAEVDGEMISGSEVRKAFRDPGKSVKQKVDLFRQLYGKFNPTIFKRITKKLQKGTKADPRVPNPSATLEPPVGAKGAEDPGGTPKDGIDPNATVRNPLTKRDILLKTALSYPQDHPAYKAARRMFKSGKLGEIFDAVMVETELANDFNSKVSGALVGTMRDECLIRPTDSAGDIFKKIKKARKHGIYHYPLTHAMHINRLPNVDGEHPDAPSTSGEPKKKESEKKTETEQLNDVLEEADSPTTRTRRFNKKHKEKVKNYLRATASDRAARNRDRKQAEDRHGTEAMKDKDVHHPDGPHGGKTQVVKKDHGPDKKNEMVSEGGAFGHMAHPYEDTDLTFGDYKDIVSKALTGDLAEEEPVTEKTDGQNISFTVKNGKVLFARNKSHTRDFAAGAIDVQGMRDMFAGRGAIEDAFGGAAEDLQQAVSKLNPEQLKELFREGENFMSAEVIYPETKNVVPYDKSILVLHGTVTYDKDGNPTNFTRDTGKVMSDMINKANAQDQRTFGIQSAKIITFNDKDTEKFAEARDKLVGEIDQLAARYSLEDDSKVAEYYARWWGEEIDRQAQQNGLQMTPEIKTALIRRFAFDDKSLKANQIPDPGIKKWLSSYSKEGFKDAKKKSQFPFEMVFLKTGATSLQRVESFMAANVPAGAEQLKREIVDSLVAVQGMDDSDKAERMEYELGRLQKVGVDKIVPSEGLIFVHKGGLYKLPGTFAPINQLLGVLRFGGRGDAPKDGEKETPGKKGYIKQFYGHKITNPETGRQITIQSALTYDPEHPARKIALQFLSTRI